MKPQPRAFEPSRLREAVRAHFRVLLAATVVALFGGAALARVLVPNEHTAEAVASLPREPHVVVAQALSPRLLAEVSGALPTQPGADWLRAHTTVRFATPDRLRVRVRSSDEGQARAAADALVRRYVALANERARVALEAARREHARLIERARSEQQHAAGALAGQQAAQGAPPLTQDVDSLRVQLAAAERAAEEAALAASSERERSSSSTAVTRAPSAREKGALVEAQRELSRLLAEHGSEHPAVVAARQRIDQRRLATSAAATPSEARVRALERRARELASVAALQRQALAVAEASLRRVAPLAGAEGEARSELAQLVARAPVAGEPARVVQAALVQRGERRALRLALSLLAPLLVLLALLGYFALRELRGFRVCAATELAHWLAVPVLTTSAWPNRQDALESLVDELADPALDALGTTLVLPLSELERPLAATLAAQLNARAQRHFRSKTGSRVTIAQTWQGELDSSRIRRAAEVADRVLWVVAADAHRGEELSLRRALVVRDGGVAAVLVDGEPRLSRSVGAAQDFWRSRPSGMLVQTPVVGT